MRSLHWCDIATVYTVFQHKMKGFYEGVFYFWMKWTSDYLDFEKDNPIYGISKNELWGIVDFTSTNSKLYICNDIVNKKRSK